MSHLTAYMSINDVNDRDGLKHPPFPPSWLDDTHRLLFLTGHVSLIEASLIRRGWLADQGAKLGSLGAVLFPGAIGRYFLRRAIHRQLASWRAYAAAHPDRVMLLSFDEIWSRQIEIADFFRIDDPAFIDTFPIRYKRQSR